MKRVNTFHLLSLGKALETLEQIEENQKYGEILIKLHSARGEISTFLQGDIVPVRICRQAGDQLITAITNVVPASWAEAAKKNADVQLGWLEAYRIKEAAKKFETVLSEELNVLDTYSVAQKGAYSTFEIISNAEVMIPHEARIKLPQQALRDIKEAGKCLAFETPTAAAFHILRATEAVVLAYYAKVTTKPVPSRMRNWGVYVNALRGTSGADPKIVEFLDHLKNHYRNPVAHPDAVMTINEVLVLFGAATSAISQMASAL